MKKTADAHWEYIEALTRKTLAREGSEDSFMTVDNIVELIGFHYRSAFIHGWKHAIETLTSEATAKTAYTVDPASVKLRSESRCAEVEPASCAPSAVVSVVSGSARRVLDADNSGEKIFKNDAEGKSPTEEEIAHVLTFLREDR